MKKLLALVLCVMMFVSVLSTAAFADQHQPAPTYGSDAKWGSLYVANKAISDTKKNIDYLYNGLAADNAVFGTIKAMDSVVVDMVKSLLSDVDEFTYDDVRDGVKGTVHVTHDALEKNAKAILRNVIGGEVSNYMNSHLGNYTEIKSHLEVDGIEAGRFFDTGLTTKAGNPLFTFDDEDGETIYVYSIKNDKWSKYTGDKSVEELTRDVDKDNWEEADTATVYDYHYDPIKYANNFATAVTKALSSEKGVANLQAYAYALMQLKVADAINDKMDDLTDAIEVWEDGTAILAAYGFADLEDGAGIWDPYAFIDPMNLPKPGVAQAYAGAILAGNDTNYFVPDFPVNPAYVIGG
jgi:hypothetical protein